ncbi:uncharacterized protein (DUF1800 family) [Pelomonas saccharophila]|uniref:Uncharacterized protein (DUF1800 family) n=1 Tax=Roseateles saccharophilus TaxID=304 RepID=A0ABU1YUK5_ROSSA|nr:DUF1800 domain-containing protein [Roseateles saccharophilus]MDR7272527.1 uncharacterized protein (DUF1800 family) [Roseateles saccharophilus]
MDNKTDTTELEQAAPDLNAGTASAALAAAAFLAACGGGGGGGSDPGPATPSTPDPTPSAAPPPSRRDAARFLSQASFGVTGPAQVDALVVQGFDAWLTAQFAKPAALHMDYLNSQRGRDQAAGETPRISEEMSYEAVWQQWLTGEDQLRARVTWALLQIFVISNIAPDIRPAAMSSYLDMLNRNAFGNWRTLLQDVALHPAMGYYLNMLESEKENASKGTHPNENFAREVLQLFSVGLIQLNADGTPKLDSAAKTQATYDEAVVRGFAKAFSGWSFGGLDNSKNSQFHNHDDNIEALWTVPMKAWVSYHSPGDKLLLDGKTLTAGQTPEQDMKDALDTIFQHPNVPPFFCKQLIQRLVTSNPSPAYVGRVAAVFVNDGAGARGNLKAVVRAVLMDAEARGDNPAANVAKQREPVIRFANMLRGLGAKSTSGLNRIQYLDSSDDALGQSPLLAPSVFNFYSPGYRPAGPIAAQGWVAPEFQISGETAVAGSLNFFADLFNSGGYGWPEEHRLKLDLASLAALDASALIDRLDLLFFNLGMSSSTRERLTALIGAVKGKTDKVRAALIVTALCPDHVIQR